MNQHVLSPSELLGIIDNLFKPSVFTEASFLLVCLGAAWFVARMARGSETARGSIWFGRVVVDGVLFPVLAMMFCLGAGRALTGVFPIALFKLAVPILASLAAIRLTVRVLRRAFPSSKVVNAAQSTISWLAWLGVALWLTGLLPLILEELGRITLTIGDTSLSVRKLVEGGFSSAVLLVLALWLASVLETKLLRNVTGADLSLRKIAVSSVRAFLLVAVAMLSVSSLGIDLTALSVVAGGLGVGLGLGLQKLAANYVSGFVILAERSLRVGDFVKVDGFEGHIKDIKNRYTVIRSVGGRESIVPNEMLMTARVENASLADRHLMLLCNVTVAYGTDLDVLRPKLVEAVAGVERVLQDPMPAVHLSAFGADGLELTIPFWIGDPDKSHLGARSAVNLVILKLLNDEGVEIPYPQRTLRIASGEPVAALSTILAAPASSAQSPA